MRGRAGANGAVLPGVGYFACGASLLANLVLVGASIMWLVLGLAPGEEVEYAAGTRGETLRTVRDAVTLSFLTCVVLVPVCVAGLGVCVPLGERRGTRLFVWGFVGVAVWIAHALLSVVVYFP
jgi:hypothetical protein